MSITRHYYSADLKRDDRGVWSVWSDREPVAEEKANLVSSELAINDAHAPVLDIDFEAQLIPSSTEGHYHLYLDKPMSWEKYAFLIQALGYCGILQPGYVEKSLMRKATFVRKPGVKKEPGDINS